MLWLLAMVGPAALNSPSSSRRGCGPAGGASPTAGAPWARARRQGKAQEGPGQDCAEGSWQEGIASVNGSSWGVAKRALQHMGTDVVA
eukprot:8601652-Lingulodinium_polyedra.AAC.1